MDARRTFGAVCAERRRADHVRGVATHSLASACDRFAVEKESLLVAQTEKLLHEPQQMRVIMYFGRITVQTGGCVGTADNQRGRDVQIYRKVGEMGNWGSTE